MRILDRFHHGTHLARLPYATCPNIQWGTTHPAKSMYSAIQIFKMKSPGSSIISE